MTQLCGCQPQPQAHLDSRQHSRTCGVHLFLTLFLPYSLPCIIFPFTLCSNPFILCVFSASVSLSQSFISLLFNMTSTFSHFYYSPLLFFIFTTLWEVRLKIWTSPKIIQSNSKQDYRFESGIPRPFSKQAASVGLAESFKSNGNKSPSGQCQS